MFQKIIALSLVVDIVVLDQVTKWFAKDMATTPVLGDLLVLQYAENTGIAFSLPLTGDLLLFFTVVFFAVLVWMYVRLQAWTSPWLNVGLACMIGGAIGNGIDRFVHGYVVDFIKVGTFPIFNIADVGVSVGVICILYYELLGRKSVAGKDV